jgi:hypothetical protein
LIDINTTKHGRLLINTHQAAWSASATDLKKPGLFPGFFI